MPPPRRQQQGLERVLGTPALFATAYGNVGSSIYYALGVTAALALGLTPLVFIIAGLIFAATAATYAEGTVRFPEAGGSSSFARHAFNEVVSFGAAWAQMLNYIITIAISAFFVPHYLSIFWDPLKENPWDVIVGALVVVLLVAINIVGVKEAARLNVLLAVIDFATQALLVILGFVLIFSPEILVNNVHFGIAPTWQSFFLAVPVAMIAYTGIETISNLAEEARDPSRDIPRSIRLVAVAVYAIYFTLPAIALSALPVTEGPDGFTTALGEPPEDGGFANDPVLGIVDNLGIEGGLLRLMEVYVGVLAATILFIAANAGVIGASRITYAMASYRQLPEPFRRLHRRFKTPWLALVLFAGARLDHRDPAGADRLPRDHVLVRGDAVVHRGPRLDRRPAGAPARRGARVPRAAEPAPRGGRLAAVRDPRRARDRPGLARGRRYRSRRRAGRGSAGSRSASSSTSSTAGGRCTCRCGTPSVRPRSCSSTSCGWSTARSWSRSCGRPSRRRPW